jgi:hypothetical protein
MGAGHQRIMHLLATLPGHGYYGTIGAGLVIVLLAILADVVLSPPQRRSRPPQRRSRPRHGPATSHPPRSFS